MCKRQVDNDQDDLLEDQHRQELVGLIWSYTLALENYVVILREQVNLLTVLEGRQPRYPDLESDFRVRFFRDSPAYEQFRNVLDAESTDWVLPG